MNTRCFALILICMSFYCPGGIATRPALAEPRECQNLIPYVPRLMSEFGWSRHQALGALASFAHESHGKAREQMGMKPGTGGYGWAQWTGPRRTAFTAFVQDKKLAAHSDDANYAFFVHELRTNFVHVAKEMKRARTLGEATTFFARAYEGAFSPGAITAMASRHKWARTLSTMASTAGETIGGEMDGSPRPDRRPAPDAAADARKAPSDAKPKSVLRAQAGAPPSFAPDKKDRQDQQAVMQVAPERLPVDTKPATADAKPATPDAKPIPTPKTASISPPSAPPTAKPAAAPRSPTIRIAVEARSAPDAFSRPVDATVAALVSPRALAEMLGTAPAPRAYGGRVRVSALARFGGSGATRSARRAGRRLAADRMPTPEADTETIGAEYEGNTKVSRRSNPRKWASTLQASDRSQIGRQYGRLKQTCGDLICEEVLDQ